MNGRDPRTIESQWAGVGGGEEDVETVAGGDFRQQPFLPPEAALASAPDRLHQNVRVLEDGIGRRRTLEVEDEAVTAREPVPEEIAEIAAGAGGPALKLARVDADDQRPVTRR